MKASKIGAMTRQWIELLAVLAAFLLTSEHPFAHATDTASSNLRGGKSNVIGAQEEARRRQLREVELSPGTRILARARSRRGRRNIKVCARKVLLDDSDDDFHDGDQQDDILKNQRHTMIIEGNGDCLHRLQNDPDILEADFDFPLRILSHDDGDSSPKAPRRMDDEVLPWGQQMIHTDELEMGEHPILVCMVDSGVAIGHPDFAGNEINGEDSATYYRRTWKWDEDRRNHGTKVAGVLSAVGGNGIGVHGAGVQNIYVTRAVDDTGEGHEADIRFAIIQCVRAGAQIISISVGGDYMSKRSERYYTRYAEHSGVLMVAAVGNDNSDEPIYPAYHSSMIAVAAVDDRGRKWRHSNYGAQVELAAPGDDILTTSATITTVEIPDGRQVDGYHISRTGTDIIDARLVFCGIGERICRNAEGAICLMHRSRESLVNMLANCEASGGVGAIVLEAFNDNVNAIRAWSIPASSDISIPAMAVTWSEGMDLLDNFVDETVVIGENMDGTRMEYSYQYASGTSFAAPHVSGAAALVWSHFGSACTNHQIRYALAMGAQESAGEECNEELGYGVVDARASYDWLVENPCSSWDVPRVSQGGCSTLQGERILLGGDRP